MFKDYKKYLRVSLKVYLFLLVCCFILKLVGLDYFGLDLQNKNILKLNHFLTTTGYSDSIIALTIYLQFYFYLCIVCNKRHLYMFALIGTVINLTVQALLVFYGKMDWLYYFSSFSIMVFLPMIINKKIFIKRQIKYIILITIYQAISLIIRNYSVYYQYYGNFLVDTILNFDQVLMIAITYNVYFMEGGLKCSAQEVGLSLQMKKKSLKLQKKLQKSYLQFKHLSKEEKATYIIYFILSFIWNVFTVFVILFIATLNNTLIECIFILSSFWLSKRIFGKPFHLKSMIQCFITSNITYYVLNRITTPLGISILIPIMLGVGLSYTTSKLVKKLYKPLYKGMPKEEFENTILKVVDKDSIKYKICYDFFIEKENAIYLGHRYNYTEAGIRKITSRVNNDIKALNK